MERDLREVRALAAMVYPSLAAHGYSGKQAVDAALEVAELLVSRSEEREQTRLDVETRAQVLAGDHSGGRPVLPQRNNIAGP